MAQHTPSHIEAGTLSPKERQAMADWRSRPLPPEFEYLREMSSIEAMGELKRLGHIKSITLVNAPPRTVSTIIMKCLAESPSLDMQGVPMMHEILRDNSRTYNNKENPYNDDWKRRSEVEGYRGSDVAMGKLIDAGILEKKGVDLIFKIMAQDFTGMDLKAFLPHVDNVVSSVRHPAIHIDCVSEKMLADGGGESSMLGEIYPSLRQYWRAFRNNVDIIDRWKETHPGQDLRHVMINGDTFLIKPAETLQAVCKELSRDRKDGVGKLEFDTKMVTSFDKPVYYAYHDGWGMGEIRATEFKSGKCHRLSDNPQNWMDEMAKGYKNYMPVYRELLPIYEDIEARYPGVAPNGLDAMPGVTAVKSPHSSWRERTTQYGPTGPHKEI